MATIKICDWCKRQLEGQFMVGKYVDINFRQKEKGAWLDYMVKVEICEKCYEELIMTMENKKKNETNPIQG